MTQPHPCLSMIHDARKTSPTTVVCDRCGEEAIITVKNGGKMIEWEWNGKPTGTIFTSERLA